MKNLEVKARYKNHASLIMLLQSIGATHTDTLYQIDTYFNVPKGRLKLREEKGKGACLVYYERGEQTQKRWSNFYIQDVPNPLEFKKYWKRALGIKVIVDKKRVLYMYKNARLHIDTVKKLGTFMEIEVMVKKGEKQAQELMNFLLKTLNIPKKDFIKVSYSDLLMK